MYNSGVRGRRGADGYGVISGRDQFIQTKLSYPSITGYNACNVNQVILDDTAVTPGGYMLLYGTAFTTGMTLTIGTATVSSYTLVNTGRIFLTVPITLSTGTYNVSIFSSTGGGAIFTTLLVSGFPIFTQITYTVLGTTVVNVQLLVSGDAPLTFSLGSSSTLPPGVSLSGTGLLSGTISPFSGTSQTYTFNVNVDDAQSQTTTQLITLSVVLGDTYWPNNTLLLDSNTPGNVNTFVTDASLNNNILTIAGDTRPNNFNPYTPGYYSNFFDGTGDYLTVPSSVNNSPQALPFTLECWVYMTATGAANRGIVLLGTANTATNSCGIYVGPTGAPNWYIWDGSTSTSGGAYTLNAWTHLAYVREGTGASQTKFYVNGVLAATTTVSATFTSPWPIYIGTSITISETLTGYISNVRFVKGTAVYTGAFTVPTSPLQATQSSGTNIAAITTTTSLLTCQSNRLIDNSFNNFTITKNGDTTVQSFIPFLIPTSTTVNNLYSAQLTGSDGRLQVPAGTAFAYGTGDFTVEGWFFVPTMTAANPPIIFSQTVSGTNYFWNGLQQSGSLLTGKVSFIGTGSGGGTEILSGSNLFTANAWNHFAVCRVSGMVTVYLNGQGGTPTANATNFTDVSYVPTIGGYTHSTTNNFSGYISNLRVVKGVAVYTGNFTPPTSNLTATQSSGTNISAITGVQTSILTCQNSTLIDNSTNAFTITSVGQAQPIALSPFTQSTTSVSLTNLGSSYFNGSTGSLNIGPTVPSSFVFGTNSFTIECWAFITSIPGGICFMGNLNASSTVYGVWTMYYYGSPSFKFTFFCNAPAVGYDFAYTIVTNQWMHVAMCRTGGNIRAFVNGVQIGATQASVVNITNSGEQSGGFFVGRTSDGFNYLPGYLSNVRIINGTGLYTSNFAPPIAQLTAVTNTQLLTVQTSQPTNNSMFVDNSSLSSLVTRAGNTNQGSFSPYGLNWSNYFDGNGDYIRKSGAGVLTTSGDVTIECWIYPLSTSVFGIFDGGIGETSIIRNYPANSICRQGNEGTGATFTVTANIWQHFACTFTAGVIKVYINGNLSGSGTYPTTYNAGLNFDIGGINPGVDNYYYNGYISNFRVTRSILYSTTFTPSTTPLTPLANTTLLTCQSASFVDNSGNNFTLTRNGDTSTQRFSPFWTTTQTPLSYSGFFDGTGDYMTVPYSANFDLSSGDWSMEAWFTAKSFASSMNIFGKDQYGVNFDYNMQVSNATTLQMSTNAVGSTLSATVPTMSINTWYHYAICRGGSVTRMFLNGIVYASSDFALTNTSNTPTIGCNSYNNPGGFFNGLISNLRVVKGVAVYTGAFTPPTSPLTATQTANSNGSPSAAITGVQTSLLTCQSSTFIDNSTNALLLTVFGDTRPKTNNSFGVTTTQGQAYTPAVFGGSGYFDGTGDYLQLANNPTYSNLNGINFTVECWAYATTAASNICLMACTSNPTATGFAIFILSGNLTVYVNTGGTTIGSIAFPLNSWNHVAFVRNSTTCTLYLNGAFVASATVNVTNPAATQPFVIGGITSSTGWNSNLYLTGYISDARVVNGVAVYTTPFVPPIAPLTVTNSNTSLFVNMTKAGIADYTRSIDLETVGDSRLITESAYNGNYYSNYFDGTGDYLSTTVTAQAPGSGNFTYECWFNVGSLASTRGIWNTRSGNTSDGFDIYILPAAQLELTYAMTVLFTSSAIVLTGIWNHVAVVRSGSTWAVYFNGGSIGTFTNSSNFTSTTLLVGTTTLGNLPFLGYISNFRYVKGVAVYTGSFTVPLSPLTATQSSGTNISAITGTDTSLLTCQSNSFRDNSTNNFTITRNGDTLVKSLNPFILNTPTSMSFDGTGDALVTPSNPSSALAGDYTVEMWVYHTTAISAEQDYILWDVTGSLGIGVNTTGVFISRRSTAVDLQSTTTLVPGVWYYLSFTRSGVASRIFVNGVQVATNNTTTTSYAQAPIAVGGASGYYFTGYIEDLRITKGVARYAGGFTPPTVKLSTF